MNTLEILTAARVKIADEKNWCQGEYARDVGGNRVYVYGSLVCSWCSVGSLRSTSGDSTASYNSAMDYLAEAMEAPIPDFNDSHTHSEVLAAWDKAIAECAQEDNK